MAALWILGILLALIVAALFLRVGVRIAFGRGAARYRRSGACADADRAASPEKAEKTEKAQGEKESA